MPAARPARPAGGQPLPGHAHPARAGRRRDGGQSVAALARRPLRPRPVADGRAAGHQAAADRRPVRRGARAAGAARGDPEPRRAGRRRPGHDRLPGPVALGPGLGLVLLGTRPRPPRCSSWRRSTRSTRVLCTIGRALLASRAAPSGPVREMLAESLGDRSVAIAYWLPGPRGVRRRGGPPRRAARARVGARVDGGRAGRASRGGDRPRRGAGHQRRARRTPPRRRRRWRSTTSA